MRNLLLWILIWTSLGATEAFGAHRRNSIAEIEYACTPKETWYLSAWVPNTLRRRITGPPHSESSALNLLAEGYRLKLSVRTPELKALGDYVIYRAYYELKLYHFAQRGFNALLDPKLPNPPLSQSVDEIAVAAANCLNQIRRNYSSMTLSAGIINSLANVQVNLLTDSQKVSYWQAVSSVAGSKIALRATTANVSTELNLLRGSGPYLTLIQALDSAKRGADSETLEYSQKLLRYPRLPESVKNHIDPIHLNLARVYYNLGDYNKAVIEFKKLRKDSNFFTSSLADRAWAYLLQKKYGEAAAAAYGFRVGDLKHIFAPDAPIILAISYFENCHYKETLESLQHFKRKYARTYRTLYDWYYQQRKSPIDYYSLLMQYLDGKKGVLPKDLASEWIRSPRFIAQQQEVNLLFDENKTARRLEREVAGRASNASKDERFFLFNLKGALVSLIKSIPETQKNLITKINTELLWRNYSMILAFVDAFENSQLVEVEAFRSMGENVLDKTERNNFQEIKNSMYKKNPDDLVPALDWGKFSTDEKEDPETWEDELGSFKADVSNICSKKKIER